MTRRTEACLCGNQQRITLVSVAVPFLACLPGPWAKRSRVVLPPSRTSRDFFSFFETAARSSKGSVAPALFSLSFWRACDAAWWVRLRTSIRTQLTHPELPPLRLVATKLLLSRPPESSTLDLHETDAEFFRNNKKAETIPVSSTGFSTLLLFLPPALVYQHDQPLFFFLFFRR